MKIKRLYLFIVLAFCMQGAYSQEKEDHLLKMRSEVSENKVLLRWVPTSAKAWRLLNQYGARLERLTVTRDGKALDEPLRAVLAKCLRPEASEAFKQMARQYSYGAIIAQAVFGDKFEVSGSGEYDVATVIALGQELQQRYVFSLYAADLCFPAAVVAGWGWEDPTALENERYLYKVISLVPEKELKIQEGSLFVDRGRKDRLPKALDFRGTFADSNVLLNWNFRTLESIYNAYVPERSTDGIHFTPISETPITQMKSEADRNNDQIMYIDSIQNGITYYYRVAGLTPFGSKGAYSDTISGKGVTELKDPPFMTKAIPNPSGGANIEWEFDPANETQIVDFMLEHSSDDKDNYRPLITGISKSERKIQVSEIRSTNYFVITANTMTGKKLRSFSALVQAIDTVPPAVPTGLIAAIDSAGAVHLSWQPNNDSDTYGYRIYRGQTEGEELIPLSDVAIKGTTFVDSIRLQSLNSNVYYALAALDERYNQSGRCPVIEVRKPEVIPPTPPFIREIKVTNGKNTLHWVSGQESTLAGYEVYKKSATNVFELLISIEGSGTTQYEDSQVENNRNYVYRVKSRTEGGLLSEPSPDYQVKAIHKTDGDKVKTDFTVTPFTGKVRLNWKTAATDVVSIHLYKKTAEGTFGLFRDGLAVAGEIVDNAVSTGFKYHYMLVIKTNKSTPVTITKEITL